MSFTNEQLERYARHILLDEVGIDGQTRLCQGRVLIIGAGGLGAPAALYLAAAGVGTIGLADPDTVDLSNLQRQILYTTADVGKQKTQRAMARLSALNPEVTVRTHVLRVTAENILPLIGAYDFILDATDNFPAKFLINDACVFAGKPYCHAGILRFNGQMLTYMPGMPCLRCLFREPPPPELAPSCREVGVIGAVAGVMGCLQAMEAIKFLTGTGTLQTGQLLHYDALKQTFRQIPIYPSAQEKCPVCGRNPSITELIDYPTACER